MSNLILIFVCLVLGLVFQRVKQFPQNSAAVLNTYVIYVALPALVLNEIPKLELDQRALLPVLMAWAVMIFSAVLTFLTARYFKWPRPVTGAMMLVVTMGNTGFVGIPLIEAFLGSNAIPYAILYDQFGTFLAMNTLGVAIAVYYSDINAESVSLWRNIIKFPPFVALLLAFALRYIGNPAWMNGVLPPLASTLVPVVMVAVGLQWHLRLERKQLAPLLTALFYILVLQPAFAFALITYMGFEGVVAHVVILEAAMPAMISGGVLAMAYQLAPRLANSIVGYSLMLSLMSVWGWKILIQ